MANLDVTSRASQIALKFIKTTETRQLIHDNEVLSTRGLRHLSFGNFLLTAIRNKFQGVGSLYHAYQEAKTELKARMHVHQSFAQMTIARLDTAHYFNDYTYGGHLITDAYTNTNRSYRIQAPDISTEKWVELHRQCTVPSVRAYSTQKSMDYVIREARTRAPYQALTESPNTVFGVWEEAGLQRRLDETTNKIHQWTINAVDGQIPSIIETYSIPRLVEANLNARV